MITKDIEQKWCIKRNHDNCNEINEWFTKVTGREFYRTTDYHFMTDQNRVVYYSYLHYPAIEVNPFNKRYIFNQVMEGYIEISFEDFKEKIMDKKFFRQIL